MGSEVSYSYVKPGNYYQSNRAEMLNYIPEDVKRTLEFGCGRGAFSELIKEKFHAECWGVEIDEESAHAASEKLHKVVRGEASDALIELPDNYFDCLIFNDLLEHLQDPFSFLENIKRKLNVGGVVVACVPNVRFWNNLRDLVWRGDWDYKEAGILDSTHLRFFTYKSLVKIFQNLKYEIIQIEGIKPTHNKKYKIINMLLWNRLWDARYHHFACVVRPQNSG